MVSLKLLEKFLYYFNIYYVFMFFILNDFYIQMRRDQERIRLTRYTIRLIFILLYKKNKALLIILFVYSRQIIVPDPLQKRHIAHVK